MEWTSFIIILILLGIISFGTFMFYRLYQKYIDSLNFVLGLNNDINEFKRSLDNLTKSNIMIYDDIVFDVVSNCKNMKNIIDAYMSKYDEYGNYIFTEETEKELKSIIGIIRPGANKGGQ